jgi:hypothetical protein
METYRAAAPEMNIAIAQSMSLSLGFLGRRPRRYM